MPIKNTLLNRIRVNDPTLKELDLAMKRLDATDIQMLINALVSNTNLKKLDLRFNWIGDEEAKALARNTNLEILYLTGSPVYPKRITDEGAKALAANQTLRLLDVSNNLIGDEGAAAFAHNTTLMVLNLRGNLIGATGTQALAQNSTLKILNLNGNPIPPEGAKAFTQNTTLITLGLEGDTLNTGKIDDKGAQALALNRTLTALNLSRNKIFDKGAKALAQNKSLTALNIGYNPTLEEGVQALAQNPSLKALCASMFTIGRQPNKEAEMLKTLAANTSLTQLYVIQRIPSKEWENSLEQIAMTNKQIRLKRNEWIEKLLVLAADRSNPTSVSAFSKLPNDLVFYIINLVALLSTHSLGKTYPQIEQCSYLVFEHILTIMTHLRQGECFRIKEQLNPRKPSNFHLHFFKPPKFSKEEIDQEITALGMDYR